MEVHRYVGWNGLCVYQPIRAPLPGRPPGQTTGLKTACEEAQKIMNDLYTSFWLRDALCALLNRDPVDALDDAEILADIMRKNLDEIQGRSR